MKDLSYGKVDVLRKEFEDKLRHLEIRQAKIVLETDQNAGKLPSLEQPEKVNSTTGNTAEKTDMYGNDIKYLMDEVHKMQEKIFDLEATNKKLSEENQSKAKLLEESNKELNNEDEKGKDFDLNRYIGVYEGMDEVMKVDRKMTEFINH
jgi:hypothetical protein